MNYVVAALFMALNFYVYHFFAQDAVIPDRTGFETFPLELGDWSCEERQQMAPHILANLGVSDYLICDYRGPEPLDVVGVYAGYHATQIRVEGGGSGENAIHPPEHCFPGSGWDIVQRETVPLEMVGLPDGSGPAKRLIVAKGNARQLVYFWYQERGRMIAEGWRQRFSVFWDRATRRRTDGALVRFTIPLQRGDEEAAERQFRAVAPQVVAALPAYVPE